VRGLSRARRLVEEYEKCELVAREFVVVKVDVGNFDRNSVSPRSMESDQDRYPAAVVLSRAIKFSTQHVQESYPTLGA